MPKRKRQGDARPPSTRSRILHFPQKEASEEGEGRGEDHFRPYPFDQVKEEGRTILPYLSATAGSHGGEGEKGHSNLSSYLPYPSQGGKGAILPIYSWRRRKRVQGDEEKKEIAFSFIISP